jgi:hypothetical protein
VSFCVTDPSDPAILTDCVSFAQKTLALQVVMLK